MNARPLWLAAAKAADDIRDIRAPLVVAPWWHWPLAIALSAASALAVVLVYRWWRKKHRRPMTPHERALAALALAEAAAHEGRSRVWADLVAETLRTSMALRLGVEGLPQTTTELKGTESPARSIDDLPAIIELLEDADLARFALASLDSAALMERTLRAREIVDRLFAPKPKAKPKVETVSSTQPTLVST